MLRRIVLSLIFLTVACLGFSEDKKPVAPPAQPPIGITKPELQRKLEELKKAQQQALADYQAITGAMQDCVFWLDQIAAKEKEVEEKAKKPAPTAKDKNFDGK
jgi:hypothetical protein